MGNPIGASPQAMPEGNDTTPLQPATTNPPGTPLGGAPFAPASSPAGAPDPIVAHHEAAKAAHDKVGYAVTQLREARTDLDKLVGMGDSVTDEDVLQSMAKWTANGADPKSLIALMAGNPANGQPPMPSGGEALKGWLADHDTQMKQMEQQLAQVHEQTGQQLGTAALRVLASDHMRQKMALPSMPKMSDFDAGTVGPTQSVPGGSRAGALGAAGALLDEGYAGQTSLTNAPSSFDQSRRNPLH